MHDAPNTSGPLAYPDPDARPKAMGNAWTGPRQLRITIAAHVFEARLETDRAPRSCRALVDLLPLRNKLFQTRWSGEATWVPLGSHEFDLPYENHTTYPLPGHLLLFKGGISQPELLLAYGATAFSSKVGPLAGNHVATLVGDAAQLAIIGQLVLWEGAQDILIEVA